MAETTRTVAEMGNEIVREIVTQEKSEPPKEIHEGNSSRTHVVGSKKSEKDKVVADSVADREPPAESVEHVVSLSESVAQVANDPVEKIVGLSDENNEVSTVLKDLGSTVEGFEEATLPISDENVGEKAGSLLRPAGVHGDDSGDSGESHMVTEIPRSTDDQPFVGATPSTRTSWMGCCGLCDVLRGSTQ
ncbi:unnamed protein product [Ilex paraguariensis]|uniref:Uncharacterized protein n=1 Tax=Ilex paraguariensis TaxID=185542 RepID=A0ABC8QKN6_9AQUA